VGGPWLSSTQGKRAVGGGGLQLLVWLDNALSQLAPHCSCHPLHPVTLYT
jgi:hypothetical protein